MMLRYQSEKTRILIFVNYLYQIREIRGEREAVKIALRDVMTVEVFAEKR